MRRPIELICALGLSAVFSLAVGCGDKDAASGSSSPSGSKNSAAPAKTSAAAAADTAVPTAAAVASVDTTPDSGADVPDPTPAPSDDPAASGAEASGDAAPAADGSDVEQYDDQVQPTDAAAANVYAQEPMVIYRGADETNFATGRIAPHTLVVIRAYRPGWVQVEWPVGDHIALGWVKQEWKSKVFVVTKDKWAPRFKRPEWKVAVKIKFAEHRHGRPVRPGHKVEHRVEEHKDEKRDEKKDEKRDEKKDEKRDEHKH